MKKEQKRTKKLKIKKLFNIEYNPPHFNIVVDFFSYIWYNNYEKVKKEYRGIGNA